MCQKPESGKCRLFIFLKSLTDNPGEHPINNKGYLHLLKYQLLD